MDVLNFSRRPRREFKPVPISSHSASLPIRSKREAMKPTLFQGHYLILPSSYCPRGWATLIEISRLEQGDKDVSRSIMPLDVARSSIFIFFIIAKNFSHFEFLAILINSSKWIFNFSLSGKLILIFVRNRNDAIILSTMIFVFWAWK